MKYLSVCSGIEAASDAWHVLGWTPVAFAETEAFPRAVLAHHYPHVPNLGDINRWREWPDAAIDVLVGGTPCQSFSVAGLRGGMADPRGNLALVYLAIADRYRPQWVVWENVPGVLSSDGGRDFGAFIGGLAELGYHAAWRVFDAQYVRVDGFARAVPQRRRRVFVVGCLGNWRGAAAVLFERESLQGHPAPRRKPRERIAPTISARPTGSGGLGTDFDLDGGLIAADLRNGTQDDVAMSLQSCGDVNPNKIPHLITAPAVAIAFDPTAGRDMRAYDDGSVPGLKVGTGLDMGWSPAVAFCENIRGEVLETEITRALASGGGKPGQGYAAVRQGWAVRRLTPLECERLQGFPDGYTAVPYRGKPAADGPRYKALGNSMAVNCMRWIGRRVEMVAAL